MRDAGMTDRRRMLAALAGGIFLLRLPGDAAHAEGGQEAELVRLLNELRRARTLDPLAVDVALIRAAEGHAAELARRDELDHVSEDGSSLGARIARTGFRYRLAAENLASGPSSAREVFDLWLRSDTHRHNMLRPRLTHCGVGRVQARAPGILGAKRSWWVLVLAERL